VRIDPNQGLTGAEGAAADRVTGAAASAPSRTAQQGPAAQSDQANLSADAQQFSNLRSAISNVPDVRQDRVASLQQAVQSGSYSVSNQQIAAALQRDSGSAAAVGKP
jgi:flagellar biosynthesis anti-sigma factor FlgM